MSILNISIAVCTINPDLCLRMLQSLMLFTKNGDQIMVFVDGQLCIKNTRINLVDFCQDNHIQIIVNDYNLGLSFCRNKALQLAKNEYLLFFDDDTILINDTLNQFREQFQSGKTIGGAKLIPPDEYRNKMRFLSPGYSYLFGIHYNEEKIWGACFGFDKRIALEHNLFFDDKLGRKGGGLQSGDDTLFVKDYLRINNNSFFLHCPVLHCFNPNRLTMQYIIRRVFWQGRSEIRRCNFKVGWQKERYRSAIHENIMQMLTAMLLRVIFLIGCLWEKIYAKGIRRNND